MLINYLTYCLILPNKKDKALSLDIASVTISIPLICSIFLLISLTSISDADARTSSISNHDKDLDKLSVNSQPDLGTATMKIKTDVIPDSDCGAWPKKSCPNNKDMKFKVLIYKSNESFSDFHMEGVYYSNVITGSPETIVLPVTPLKSGSVSYSVILEDSSKTINPRHTSGGHWFLNTKVTDWFCNGQISKGDTVQCHIVVHYAWSDD